MDTRLSPGPDPSSSAIPFPLSTVVPASDAGRFHAGYPLPAEPNTPNYKAYTYNGFNFSLTTGFSPIHPPPVRPPSVDTLQSVSTFVGSPPPSISVEIRISIGIDIGPWIFNNII
jgi:hypothetical protein